MKRNRPYQIIRWLCIILLLVWILQIFITYSITTGDIIAIIVNGVIILALNYLTAQERHAK